MRPGCGSSCILEQNVGTHTVESGKWNGPRNMPITHQLKWAGEDSIVRGSRGTGADGALTLGRRPLGPSRIR